MSILSIIMISAGTMFLGYQIGKFKGVDLYHEYLLSEGKIHEKSDIGG